MSCSDLDLLVSFAITEGCEIETGNTRRHDAALAKRQAQELKVLANMEQDKADAERYRKIKRISTKHGGIDIYEEPGLVNVFHSGIDKMKGQEAPTLDQVIDKVVE